MLWINYFSSDENRNGIKKDSNHLHTVTQGRFFCLDHRPLPRRVPFVTKKDHLFEYFITPGGHLMSIRLLFAVKYKNSLHIRSVRVTLRAKHKNLTHILQRWQRLHTINNRKTSASFNRIRSPVSSTCHRIMLLISNY